MSERSVFHRGERVIQERAGELDLADRVGGDAGAGRAPGIGVFYAAAEELATRLRDREAMQVLRANVWRQRRLFCFDHHVPELVAFFRKVIRSAAAGPRTAA